MLQKLRHPVFWPPFLLLVGALTHSLIDPDGFLELVTRINTWILDHFSWLFSGGTLLMFLTCCVLFFSPLGRVRIGGPDAQPLLNRWQWFSIVLCTTIAIGILFWGTAEPIFHISNPPESLGLEPYSPAAYTFSMSTMFLHWSFTPYAIYSIPTIMFALAYYNRKQAFTLGGTLFPFFKNKPHPWLDVSLDAICLYTLVAGMAANLGVGILSLSGGLENLYGIPKSTLSLGLICAVVVIAFIASAASGLLKGIRILSDINVRIFFIICLFILIAGPTLYIFQSLWAGLADYVVNFFPKSLFTGNAANDPWPKSWTVFYWANWLSWAPITALFLGRIAYGRTVRQVLLYNWIIPSCFAIVWMSIFSGTALNLQLEAGANLSGVLAESGFEAIVYQVFENLPLSGISIFVFIIAIFISFVTAADSSTEAMSGISSTGISPQSPEPPVFIKTVWGLIIGLVAFIMISYAGIDGIKMLSNLGGLPALFLLLTVNVGLIMLMVNPGKYLKS